MQLATRPRTEERIRSTARPWLTPTGTAAAAVLAGIALVSHDPHATGSWGTCPVYALTGHYCPGCGSLRALHDVAIGRWGEAIGHNLLAVPALTWLVWWWISRAAAAAGAPLPGPPSSARFCTALLAVLAIFTVLRNLPGSPLAP